MVGLPGRAFSAPSPGADGLLLAPDFLADDRLVLSWEEIVAMPDLANIERIVQ